MHKEVITIQTDINERDDCHHKVVMARNSLQTEVDDLNKKNKNLKKDKDELIQQKKQLEEDARTNLITAREAYDRDRDSSRKIEEYQRHENEQTKKEYRNNRRKHSIENKHTAFQGQSKNKGRRSKTKKIRF